MSIDLHDAIRSHDLARLAARLAAGDNPDALDPEEPRWSALHAAIEELEDGGDLEALALLVRCGASVDTWDGHHDSTPLLMAIFRGQREAALLLLAAGACPNVAGAEGDTPLTVCSERGDTRMAATLIRFGAGATINQAGGPTGMSALGHAASRLDLDMIELLVSAGASLDAQDADRRLARERLPPRTEKFAAGYDRAFRMLLGS